MIIASIPQCDIISTVVSLKYLITSLCARYPFLLSPSFGFLLFLPFFLPGLSSLLCLTSDTSSIEEVSLSGSGASSPSDESFRVTAWWEKKDHLEISHLPLGTRPKNWIYPSPGIKNLQHAHTVNSYRFVGFPDCLDVDAAQFSASCTPSTKLDPSQWQAEYKSPQKPQRGKRPEREKWVLGLFDTQYAPARPYLQIVPRRNAQTLLPIIGRKLPPDLSYVRTAGLPTTVHGELFVCSISL